MSRRHLEPFRRAFHTSPVTFSPRARGTYRDGPPTIARYQGSPIISVSERAIQRIFSGTLSRAAGNELLSLLQKNREQGKVDASVAGHDADTLEAGLSFLRSRYPMNEDAAIIARVDKEFDNEFRMPQTEIEHSRSQDSRLKQLRFESIEREKREEARKNAEEQRQLKQERAVVARHQVKGKDGNHGKLISPRTSTDLVAPDQHQKSRPKWIQKYHDHVDTEIPNFTLRARLVPGGLFTLAVVLLSLWFADTYIPPASSARLFPDVPPAAAACQVLVTLNIVVYLLWRVPPLWSTLNKYFINLPIKPRAPQLLLAAFSHQKFPHLAANALVLWFVGVHLHDSIGRGPFLALVFSSAVLASYSSLLVFVLRNVFFTGTCGASGIGAALVAASCTLHEGLGVSFPFLPQSWTLWIDTGFLLFIIIVQELVSLRRSGLLGAKSFQKNGFTMDHIGHLAGYGTGLSAGLLIRQRDPRWQDMKRDSTWRRILEKRTQDQTQQTSERRRGG